MAANDVVPRKFCLIEDHLWVGLESEKYGDCLVWEDRKKMIFRIAWFVQFRPGTRHWKKEYANLFLDWEKMKGRPAIATSSNISKSKERIRNALRRSPKVKELPKDGIYRRYQIIKSEVNLITASPNELQSSTSPEIESGPQCQEENPKSVRSECSACESDTSGYDSGLSPSPHNKDEYSGQVPDDADLKDQIPQIPSSYYTEECSSVQLSEPCNQIMVNGESTSTCFVFDIEVPIDDLLELFPVKPTPDGSECNVIQAGTAEVVTTSESEKVAGKSVFADEMFHSIFLEPPESNEMETVATNQFPCYQNADANNLNLAPSFDADNQAVFNEPSSTELIETLSVDSDMEWIPSELLSDDKCLTNLDEIYGGILLQSSGDLYSDDLNF